MNKTSPGPERSLPFLIGIRRKMNEKATKNMSDAKIIHLDARHSSFAHSFFCSKQSALNIVVLAIFSIASLVRKA